MTRLRQFLRCSSGNTAIVFALSVVPLLLAVGASVDMVRATRAQAMLQAAADAAALSAAAQYDDPQSGGGGGSPSDLTAIATSLVENYVEVNGASTAVDSIQSVATDIDETNRTLTVTINGKMHTTLLQLAGIEDVDVTTSATVAYGSTGLEVVLVLDNTGSMAGQKILDLKAAATNLVGHLFEQKSSGSPLKIGIVPFSEYVNVGTGATGGWLANTVLPVGSAWEGCVGSRSSPGDIDIKVAGNKYDPVGNVHCVTPLLDLTDVKTTLEAKIAAMQAEGNTYIPGGLLWGWNMLDSAEPLKSAKTDIEMKKQGGKKVLVLMTDGENTISANAPFNDGGDTVAANQATKTLCANIKSAEIEVFTVAFQLNNLDAKDILEQCATDPSMAFDAANGAALNAAFASIADKLANHYLAK